MASRALTPVVDAPTGELRSIGGGEPLDRAEMNRVRLRSLPRPAKLDAPLTTLRGAGKKLSATASTIGIDTVGDLLAHVPHGYRDHSTIRKLGELRLGEEATVIAEVRSARVRPTRRRNLRIVEATVADETGPLKAVWFNQAYLAEKLRPGVHVLLHGKLDRQGLRVSQPRDRRAAARARPGSTRSGSSRSTRPPTGCPPTGCASGPGRRCPSPSTRSSRCRRSCVRAGGMPLGARRGAGRALPGRPRRTRASARERLAFEELFLHQVALAARRRREREGRPGVAARAARRTSSRGGSTRCRSSPPSGQLQALDEIDADLGSGQADAAAPDGRGRAAARRSSPSTRCSAPSRAATRRR